MMVLIVNNKIVGTGFSEGWLLNELRIVLGDDGGVVCEDGERLKVDFGDDGVCDLFMSCDCIIEMLMEGEIVDILNSKDELIYIGLSNIDLNDEL